MANLPPQFRKKAPTSKAAMDYLAGPSPESDGAPDPAVKDDGASADQDLVSAVSDLIAKYGEKKVEAEVQKQCEAVEGSDDSSGSMHDAGSMSEEA